MTWEEVFKKFVEGREVTGSVSDEGDYKVRTSTKSDYPGNATSDGDQHVISSPVAAGSPVSIDGEDLEDLQRNLVSDGEFSEEAAAEIVKAFGD